MASYSIASRPNNGGRIEIFVNGEKQNPQGNYFHTGGFDEVVFKAIPSPGYEFKEFRGTSQGIVTDNPLILKLPYGTSIVAHFQEDEKSQAWKIFLEQEEINRMADLRAKFEAMNKQEVKQ